MMSTGVFGLFDGLIESFYKNVCCDQIQPIRGSILKVDLAGELVKSSCHTGIYVGGNRIVEMTNDNGKGVIKKVPPKYFLNYSSLRTGIFIYVACGKKNGKYYPLGSEDIAERAEQAIGNTVDYNLLLENCHLFTEKCIAGEEKSLPGTLDGGEPAPAVWAAGECLPLHRHTWRGGRSADTKIQSSSGDFMGTKSLHLYIPSPKSSQGRQIGFLDVNRR